MLEDFTFVSGDWSSWPTVTEDTTVEELQFIHKKIWGYVVEYGEKPDTPYINGCAACEYITTRKGSRSVHCSYCPICWPKQEECGSCGSLYSRWLHSDGDARRKIAQQIRDVEWRKPCSTP